MYLRGLKKKARFAENRFEASNWEFGTGTQILVILVQKQRFWSVLEHPIFQNVENYSATIRPAHGFLLGQPRMKPFFAKFDFFRYLSRTTT